MRDEGREMSRRDCPSLISLLSSLVLSPRTEPPPSSRLSPPPSPETPLEPLSRVHQRSASSGRTHAIEQVFSPPPPALPAPPRAPSNGPSPSPDPFLPRRTWPRAPTDPPPSPHPPPMHR